MIVVIADDLTGAAELAGIALRYGLSVEMSINVPLDSNAEVLIISTDTRSLKEDLAIGEVADITNSVMLLNPEIVYKKIDSVLRGHVIAELAVQLEILGKKTALIIAPNPSLGRSINNGVYYFHGEPIHLSSFSIDPEFAITSSEVLQMVRVGKRNNVNLALVGDDLKKGRIYIGEVSLESEMNLWAAKVNDEVLPAGGSDFFAAILRSRGMNANEEAASILPETEVPALFVCGSTFNKSRQLIKEIKSVNGPVSYMPMEVMTSSDFNIEYYQLWSNEIVSFLHSKGKAIIAIDPETVPISFVSAKMLREKMAFVVKQVFEIINIHSLYIEGGATAASVLRELDIQNFVSVAEYKQGVVKMRVKEMKELFITVKPGSYDWPEQVWDF